jgi:hypothetical protein
MDNNPAFPRATRDPASTAYWSRVPADVAAKAARRSSYYKFDGAQPDNVAWRALLGAGAEFHGTADNLPTADEDGWQLESRARRYEEEAVLSDYATYVTPQEVLAWRAALLVGQPGYNPLQPVALRLAHVRAIASWKKRGRTIADIDPTDIETICLRIGICLEDLPSWNDDLTRGVLSQPEFAAFVAEGGTPEYAADLTRIWREAREAGQVDGLCSVYHLGFMMRFAGYLSSALPHYLSMCAPREIGMSEIATYFLRTVEYQDEPWHEVRDAALHGLSVVEWRIRDAWIRTHLEELDEISKEIRDAYTAAGIPPWEIPEWEKRFGGTDPALRTFLLERVTEILRRQRADAE